MDTSVGGGGDLVPYLNLGAFQLQRDQNLDDAIQEADDEEQMGFLYNILDPKGSLSLDTRLVGSILIGPTRSTRGIGH